MSALNENNPPTLWVMSQRFDVIVMGGGHNGLVAACYLADAGLKVGVLENQPVFGGAAVSEEPFPGVGARLSRYSYLVSLFPEKIRNDLGLSLELRRRRFSSYTPVPGGPGGLLIDTADPARTEASFRSIGAAEDWTAWQEFYRETTELAGVVFPRVTDPLLTRGEMRALVEQQTGSTRVWDTLIETPLRRVVEDRFTSDLVGGVVMTDGLIGTFPDSPDDMAASICFLYHVIGGGTGDWDVPVGGMGALTGSLERAARRRGVTLVSSAEITHIEGTEVTWRDGQSERSASARLLLAGFSPTELARIRGDEPPSPHAEGAQVKVNMVLERLPRLKDSSVRPEEAFGGTFHINELLSQFDQASSRVLGGDFPDPIPAEIYCHSLTDPSILDHRLQQLGAQTLTVFALHVPHRLMQGRDADDTRERLQRKVLDSLNSVLAEPIDGLILRDANGQPCVETKTTADLEKSLRLPGGNIFHGPLSWPFAEDTEDLTQPAARWGVASGTDTILLAGSGARRGGAVSGIAGHNAAMASLELLS